jgi:hypothetical protein
MFSPGADTIAFSEGGVEAMRITSAGDVGIGTSAPGAKLHVSGGTVGTTAGNLLNVTIDQGLAGGNAVGIRTNLVRVSNGTDWTTTAMRLQGRVDATDFGYIDLVTGGAQGMAFGSGGTERMRIDASGNVGIGTTSPATKLDVIGTIYSRPGGAAGAVAELTADASSGANGISLIAGFTSGGYGPIKLLTSATERMRIDASGNVGIGTSAPGNKLSVNGDASFGDTIFTGTGVSTGDCKIELGGNRSSTGNSYIDFHSAAGTDFSARILRTSGVNGQFEIVNTGTASLILGTNNTERARIDSSGNLMLGTTSASGRFTVQTTDGNTAFFDSTDTAGGLKGVAIRSIAASGTATPFLALRQWRSSFAGNGDVAQIRFDGLTTTGGYAEFASIYVSAGTNTASGAPTAITFQTMNASFVSAERMRINASGDVGIGTASPASLLHVKRGSNATEVYPTGTWATRVINATDGSGENGLLVGNRWAASSSTVFEAGSIFGGGSGSWYSFYKIDGVGQSFWSSGGTQRMQLDTSGFLGIGVIPNARLDVLAGSNQRLLFTERGTGCSVIDSVNAANNAYQLFLLNGSAMIFQTGAVEKMRIVADGAVGIGLSTPNATLHLQGIKGGNARMTQSSTGGTSENNLNIIASSSAGGADQWYSYGVTASNYFFLQTGVGTGDSGLVVNSNNRVIVGTSTTFDTTVGANFMSLGTAGSAAAFKVNATSSTQVSFYDSTQSARVGWIGTSGSSTSYNTTSDRRLKKNIKPVGDVGAKIDQIEVVSHEWTNGTDAVIPYAFIAQDLYEAAPHAVSKGDDGEEVGLEWAVDYSKLVPMLVKEMQSLRARVAQLEGK